MILSGKDIESVLPMRDAVEAVEEAFREQSLGTIQMPLRSTIKVEKHNGSILFMPAYLEGMGSVGVKVVTVYPNNPSKHNLPTILGTVLLNDSETGKLLAVMDGALLTAMRTGAAGAVATKYLARKDASKIGIIGTGVQGITQVAGACEVRPIREVRAYDVVAERCDQFCSQVSKTHGIKAVPVDSPEEAVRGADIVVTASTSKVPVVKGSWVDKGTHINGIGSHSPEARELDSDAIKISKVIVDSREAVLKEAGDLIIPISEKTIQPDHIYAELGELITGKKAARQNDQEITLFKSVGLAIQDASTAHKIYENALKRGIGQVLEV